MIDPAALQMVLGVLTGWLDRREREAVAIVVRDPLAEDGPHVASIEQDHEI